MNQTFQLEESGPAAYERYLVPAFFEPCADLLLALSPPHPGERVLDLACGTGVVARRASTFVGPEGGVVGVDVNASMIDFASRAPANLPGPVEWSRADAVALPLPDDSIDVGCCQQGLQFFQDPSAVLLELRRVIAPGGRLLIALWHPLEDNPGFVHLVNLLDRHLGPAAAALMRAPFAGPGPDDLRSRLTASGFPVVEVGSVGFAARFPSASAFLRQEAAGSPLAGPLEQAGPEAAATLVADLEQSLAPYVDEIGLALPMQTRLVLARSAAAPGQGRS